MTFRNGFSPGAGTRFIPIIAWVVLMLIPVPILAAEFAAIVYGSFTSEIRAQDHLQAIQVKVSDELSMHNVLINGIPYYRILGTASRDVEQQRKRLDAARGLVAGAWLYRYQQPLEQQHNVAGSVSPSAAAVPVVSEPVELSTNPTHSAATIIEAPAAVIPAGPILQIASFTDTAAAIVIDGRLDEPIWERVPAVDEMVVIEPDTLAPARYSTQVRFIRTERGLYVGIWNEQPQGTLLERLTKRDADINRDGNSLLLDTSGDALYGLWFDVNLGGSLADGNLLPEKTFSTNWDGPWKGDATAVEGGYTTEYFLPWSMMAMPEVEGERHMKVMIRRRVAHLDETWGWPGLPLTGQKFMSAMQPVAIQDVDPRQQWAVYPYASVTYDNIADDTSYRSGADIFWRPSSNLQITATLNPDFGTVESDDVVVNLTAFETFFREKRLFFVEGNEVFITTPRSNPFGTSSSNNIGARRTASSFFPSPTTLVNTRRIGSAAIEPVIPEGGAIEDVELYKPTELYGAFKITGQQGGWRYGAMTAFEEDSRFHGTDAGNNPLRLEQDGRDFGVVRLSYEDTGNGIRSLGWVSTAVMHPDRDAFVHGIDGHYISADGRFRTDLQLMASDVDEQEGYGGMLDLAYRPRQGVSHKLTMDYFDEDIDINDFGFFRRNDLIAAMYNWEVLRSDMQSLRAWSRSLVVSQEYNQAGRVVRSGIFWRNDLTFNSRNALRTELNYFPARWDDRNSEGNGEFRIEDRWVAELGYGTDTSRPFSFSLAAGVMQEELGGWTEVAKGGFTFKPNDRVSLDLDFIYQHRDDWLLHTDGRLFTTYDSVNWYPKLALDYFLTARQQLRLTAQWAGIKADAQDHYLVPVDDGDLIYVGENDPTNSADFGISQLSLQLRYRWEIAPLSDLYLVYTRGSKIVDGGDQDMEDFFREALTEPLVDFFVLKLRYRFGT